MSVYWMIRNQKSEIEKQLSDTQKQLNYGNKEKLKSQHNCKCCDSSRQLGTCSSCGGWVS